MSDLLSTLVRPVSMTSREIADLVESRHDNVKRTVERLAERGVVSHPPMEDGDRAANGVVEQVYVFDLAHKRDTFIVVAQLSPEFTARLVDRWQELEALNAASAAVQPLLPAQIGELTIASMLRVADLCEVPRSYAIQLAGSEATRQTGMPWDRLLTQAKAMGNVPAEDLMLEPTELGKLFDLTAVAMNRWLAGRGLQEKVAGEWRPTEVGAALCQRHAWVSGSKSGYNLKWKAAEIERLMVE